jgi:hypothetical protein
MKYFEEAKFLWQNFVPQSGQADKIQGELIRAVERLRDEAQRMAISIGTKAMKSLAGLL